MARAEDLYPVASNADGPAQVAPDPVAPTARATGRDAPVGSGAEDEAVAIETTQARISEPRYRFVEPIAAGGQGEIWLVDDRAMNRRLAMKVHVDRGRTAQARQRLRADFFNEARITSNLQHPGIVPVHDIGTLADGRPFFTMKVVRGETFSVCIHNLHRAAQRTGPAAADDTSQYGAQSRPQQLALRRIVEQLARAAEALAYAHRQGFVHRDIKPGNLMVGEFGEVLVMDWGLAARAATHSGSSSARDSSTSGAVTTGLDNPESAVTEADRASWVARLDSLRSGGGRLEGTVSYMAPEQARCEIESIGFATDVYALGAVLYEVLCGVPPFARHGFDELLIRLRGNEPPRSLMSFSTSALRPPELCKICQIAMDVLPSQRYRDAFALATALREWLDGIRRYDHALEQVDRARRRWGLPAPGWALEPPTQSLTDMGRRAALLANEVVELAKADRPRASVAVLRQRTATLEVALDHCLADERDDISTRDLRSLARELRAQAERVLSVVQTSQPAWLKETAWALSQLAARLELRASVQEVELQQLLRSALNEVPDHDQAHALLAEYYFGQLRAAERSRDRDAVARFEVLLSAHHRGAPRFVAYLRGDAALSVVTDRPDVRVTLLRYHSIRHRLLPRESQRLGRGPLNERVLTAGSYLLILRAPGCATVRYPVLLERGSHWAGCRPDPATMKGPGDPSQVGPAGPVPIPLLPRDALGEDDVYVPAGWFLSGGDPSAAESLPRRWLWADGFVIKKRPVTRRAYQNYLNELVVTGRAELAERHAPKLPGSNTQLGPQTAWTRGYDGLFQLDPFWDDPKQPGWPVTLVDWDDARAYASWYSQRTGKTWRLPSELEWEKAARGVDGRFFPWGDAAEPSFARVADGRGNAFPSPCATDAVSLFSVDKSPYGVLGMAGNVRDWCLEAWSAEASSVAGGLLVVPRAPLAPDQAQLCLRGGAWPSPLDRARTASRYVGRRDFVFRGLGIRLVRGI